MSVHPVQEAYDPGPGEPYLGPYSATDFASWADVLVPPRTDARPLVLGIDGRGGSGKTTLASRLAAHHRRSAVIHTDDLAWNHSIVGWHRMLIDDVLTPLLEGFAVDYRPRAWIDHGRVGSIAVPVGLDLIIVEGTGTISETLLPYLDASVWVQSDYQRTEERVVARDAATGVNGDHASAARFWAEWQREEVPFLQRQRPWEHADAILDGSDRELSGSLVPVSAGRLR